MTEGKKDRLTAIREIISTHDISSQDEILNELTKRGFSLTQATLSRDIKKLQIAKVPDSMGNYRYHVAPNIVSRQTVQTQAGTGADIISKSAVSIEFSGQMAVVKTTPGYASVVADIVDKSQCEGIMGTLAGDDTVLIILRENVLHKTIVGHLMHWLPDIDKKIL